MNITTWDIVIIIGAVLGLIFVGLYFLNRWAATKMTAQQDAIEKAKTAATIYVIDKKRDKAENVNLPKVVYEKMTRYNKLLKMYFVKAKIGSQIMTLMCDKKVFNNLEPQKTYKVEIAGIYISSIKGMKSDSEIKKIGLEKKEKAKRLEIEAKEAAKAAAKAAKKSGK